MKYVIKKQGNENKGNNPIKKKKEKKKIKARRLE